VRSHLHISVGLNSAKARELLINIGRATLQFYKAPYSFVRRVTDFLCIADVLVSETPEGTGRQRSGVKRSAIDCCEKRKIVGADLFPARKEIFHFSKT
jgi:hypothetical protein